MGHSDVQTTLRIYTHPEQLNRAVFLNGKMTENEKLEHLKREYAEVLEIIDNFLKWFTHFLPIFTHKITKK